MTDKTDGVLAVLDREIFLAPCQEGAQTLKTIRDAVAELLAADEEYDAALGDCRNLGTVVTPEMEARRELAEVRRAAAIRAMRGES